MKTFFRSLILIAAICRTPVFLLAQHTNAPGVGQPGTSELEDIKAQIWTVAGKVSTLHGDPVRGVKVLVKATNVMGESRTVETDFQGEFRTEFRLNADAVKELSVDVTATKADYPPARTKVDFGDSNATREIAITLRDAQEDPQLLPQADLISAVAPRLRNLEASEGLSASAAKDYAAGVREFLEQNHPDRALPLFNKAVRHDTSCMACLTMLSLAELASGDWDGAYRNIAEAAKQTLANPAAGRPEPLLVRGVMESWRHEPKQAASLFVEALKLAPQDTLSLQELGRSQLLIQNWGAAREYLAKAMTAGAKPEVRIMLVEALLREGNPVEADKEMTKYLDGRDVKKMPTPVRTLWLQIRDGEKVEARQRPGADSVEPIDYLHRAVPELQGLEPATDQGQLTAILDGVGKNVAAFFQGFPNTISSEQVHQEKVRQNGKIGGTLDQKFHYLCLMPAQAWGPGFSEYRTDLSGITSGQAGLQEGFMLTSGFASASLIFHPVHQMETTFKYLGRQKFEGRDTFVIAYAQQPAKAQLTGVFKINGTAFTTYTQGLAWVDSESYQILRLRTDLLAPVQQVKLERQTTEIDFGKVHFKDVAADLWLPGEVTVTVDWNGKELRNKHEYSDFKLFNVDSMQKIGNPKEAGQNPR